MESIAKPVRRNGRVVSVRRMMHREKCPHADRAWSRKAFSAGSRELLSPRCISKAVVLLGLSTLAWTAVGAAPVDDARLRAADSDRANTG